MQVLKFDPGEQPYCVPIEHVREIVDEKAHTAVADGPSHVLGVVNLRKKTTTIVDPTVIFDLESSSADDGSTYTTTGSPAGGSTPSTTRVRSTPETPRSRPTPRRSKACSTTKKAFCWLDPTAINQD